MRATTPTYPLHTLPALRRHEERVRLRVLAAIPPLARGGRPRGGVAHALSPSLVCTRVRKSARICDSRFCFSS